MDLVRKFKRRLRSIGGGPSGITAIAGGGESSKPSAECAGDWPSGVISKSFTVECGASHAGPNSFLGTTNLCARPVPVPVNRCSSHSDSRRKELQPEALRVDIISDEESQRQRSFKPRGGAPPHALPQQRGVGARGADRPHSRAGECPADQCAADGCGAGNSPRESRSDEEDRGSDENENDNEVGDLRRRHTWQLQSQLHPSDSADLTSARGLGDTRHSNRHGDSSYFEHSAGLAGLVGPVPASGVAPSPRLTEALLLLMQATQHQSPHGSSSSSSGLTSEWPRQQLLQHRKVIEWLALLSDPVEPPPTEGPFEAAVLQPANASKANEAAVALAVLAAERGASRIATCVSASHLDGSLLDGRASPIPPAEGDLLHLPASLAANRQRKLECDGSPSGTPSPGVPSPRGVVTMQGGGGAGSSGDGEEAENGRRKASGRRDCAAGKAEALQDCGRRDCGPGFERTATAGQDIKGSCSDAGGSDCGDPEGGSPRKWGLLADESVPESANAGAGENMLGSVRAAFRQLTATSQSEQVRGARALRDLARESDAVRSAIVAVGVIPALVSIVNLAATAPHAAAATHDIPVASPSGVAAAGGTDTSLGGGLRTTPCAEGGIDAAAQGGRERGLAGPLVDYSISCLVNLSITRDMKATICQAGAIPPLIRLMCPARSPSCAPACACCASASASASTRANAAVALLSLSKLSDAIRLHMAYSGGVEALVHFLSDATNAPDHPAAAAGGAAGPQGSSSKSRKGRREAAAALQSLASVAAVRPRLVHAGAVPLLLELIAHAAASHLTCSGGGGLRGAERSAQRMGRAEDDAVATAERALAVLALLADNEEGRAEVQRRGGMEVLVGVVRAGGPSDTCVERAVAGLMAMVGGSLACRWEVARIGVEGAVKQVAVNGSGKAKAKAIKFMDMLRAPPALG
ncbi:hypothetical protein CLOP_g20301 [Closterium sp. NIES-67]|nr:hypothetical protein CLOP_g20301 [Closterium sp. NIES-67]